jgi:hypothetical protein
MPQLNTRDCHVINRATWAERKLLIVLLASDVVCHGDSIGIFGVEMPVGAICNIRKHISSISKCCNLPEDLVMRVVHIPHYRNAPFGRVISDFEKDVPCGLWGLRRLSDH